MKALKYFLIFIFIGVINLNAYFQKPLYIPFKDGEKFIYEVSWIGIVAGTVSFEVKNDYLDSTPLYHLFVKAQTGKFFSHFFTVRDYIESYFTKDKFLTVYFRKNLREGKYRKVQKVKYDLENRYFILREGKQSYTKIKEGKFPKGARDPITALYYVRTLPFEKGKIINVIAHADGKIYPLKIKIHGIEYVSTRLGEFRTWKIEPLPTFEGRIFKISKSRLRIWVTDDEKRIPVLIKADVKIGNIKAELIQIQY